LGEELSLFLLLSSVNELPPTEVAGGKRDDDGDGLPQK